MRNDVAATPFLLVSGHDPKVSPGENHSNFLELKNVLEANDIPFKILQLDAHGRPDEAPAIPVFATFITSVENKHEVLRLVESYFGQTHYVEVDAFGVGTKVGLRDAGEQSVVGHLAQVQRYQLKAGDTFMTTETGQLYAWK